MSANFPKAMRPMIAAINMRNTTLPAFSNGSPRSCISGTKCIKGTDMQMQQNITDMPSLVTTTFVGNSADNRSSVALSPVMVSGVRSGGTAEIDRAGEDRQVHDPHEPDVQRVPAGPSHSMDIAPLTLPRRWRVAGPSLSREGRASVLDVKVVVVARGGLP